MNKYIVYNDYTNDFYHFDSKERMEKWIDSWQSNYMNDVKPLGSLHVFEHKETFNYKVIDKGKENSIWKMVRK